MERKKMAVRDNSFHFGIFVIIIYAKNKKEIEPCGGGEKISMEDGKSLYLNSGLGSIEIFRFSSNVLQRYYIIKALEESLSNFIDIAFLYLARVKADFIAP
jgi:hypothetical protein